MTLTKRDINEITRFVDEAKSAEKRWRDAMSDTFPVGTPVKFALNNTTAEGEHISYHEGTASKHQMSEPCDQLLVNVDPETIPDGWKWDLSKEPCSCCNQHYFRVPLANVKFCLKR